MSMSSSTIISTNTGTSTPISETMNDLIDEQQQQHAQTHHHQQHQHAQTQYQRHRRRDSGPPFRFPSAVKLVAMTLVSLSIGLLTTTSFTLWYASTISSNLHLDLQKQNMIRILQVNPTSATRTTSRTISENENENKSEIMCLDESYSAIADLTYTYSMETTIGADVTTVLSDLEHALLNYLADALLFCNTRKHRHKHRHTHTRRHRHTRNRKRTRKLENTNTHHTRPRKKLVRRRRRVQSQPVTVGGTSDNSIDEYSLGIVGISSSPDDVPSTKSTCASPGTDCTVVLGALNLSLRSSAELPMVRYAARYNIREAMVNDALVSQVNGLEGLQYIGPDIIIPSDHELHLDEDGDGDGDLINGGMGGKNKKNGVDINEPQLSRLQIVVIATLISSIVGIIGSIILFKKVFTKQNCMTPCDGSGIDKDYMENHSYGHNNINNMMNGSSFHTSRMSPESAGTGAGTGAGADSFENNQESDSDSCDDGGSGTPVRGGWNMNSVSVTHGHPHSHGHPHGHPHGRARPLSAIDENSMENSSDACSIYSSSVMSHATQRSTAPFHKSMASSSSWNEEGSVHSEQTQVVSNSSTRRLFKNKNSTPSFGDVDSKENVIMSYDMSSSPSRVVI